MPAQNRLNSRLAAILQRRKKALALFLTAGFPAADATPGIALALAEAGADVIEIGMPFSDPMADGPLIQESSVIALRNGVTISGILEAVRSIRASSNVPVVLMGYLNPIFTYGPERFFMDAAASGVDGVILPELTLEESSRFSTLTAERGLSQILLVAPTTPPERITAIDAVSSGFLYCVSTTGVTGSAGKGPPDEYLKRVRSCAKVNPLLVGFGISGAAAARDAARCSDGVIIGSALIERLLRRDPIESVAAWVRSVRDALALV